MNKVYPLTKIYFLNENYRSDWHIVALANASIKNNTERYEKTMNNILEHQNLPRLINDKIYYCKA